MNPLSSPYNRTATCLKEVALGVEELRYSLRALAHPQRAGMPQTQHRLQQRAAQLKEQLLPLLPLLEQLTQAQKPELPTHSPTGVPYCTSLPALGLPLGLCNALHREGLFSLGDLVERTTLQELRTIRHIGPKGIEKVQQAVRDLGLELRS